MATQILHFNGITNTEFFERHAAPGRIGLVCGSSLVDHAITRAQRSLDTDAGSRGWSHAFLLQGRRMDGVHWVIESDLEIHRRHLRLGVQENRVTKFCGDGDYPRVAVLDVGLTESQAQAVLAAGLGLVADRTRYSIRELFGTLLAVQKPELRSQANRLARKRSLFCSAFVQHCFRQAGLDLMPGVDTKNTTPNDLANSPAARTLWILERPANAPKLVRTAQKLRSVAGRLRGH